MKKMMSYCGISDVYSCSCGHTRTKGNFMKATFEALRASYSFITPDLWPETGFKLTPYQEFSDDLADYVKMKTM
jgi:small subunit ribosomal protein S2e